MKTTDYFKKTIQNYLEQRAQTDELFAPVYAKAIILYVIFSYIFQGLSLAGKH